MTKSELYLPQVGSTVNIDSNLKYFHISLDQNLTKFAALNILSQNALISRLHAAVSDRILLNPITKTNNLFEIEPIDHEKSLTILRKNLMNTKLCFGLPKLPEVRSDLSRNGKKTEFMSGSLVVQKLVAVKKLESNGFLIEGVLCPEYFEVRKLVYDKLVKV